MELPATHLPGWHREEEVALLRYRRLGATDMLVSPVGVGGCVVGGVYPDAAGREEILQAIETALRAGLNYVDTSPFYGEGKSEEVLGEALRRVPRHAYYIGTKVGRYGATWETAFDFSPERILREFDRSLERLQLTYVDIIQVHDFEFAQDPARIAMEVLPVLEGIVRSGRARYIGITGFPLQEFHSVLDRATTKVDTVLSYARNIFVDTSLQDHLPYFKSKQMGVINASPTGMGLLTNAGPPPWHPAPEPLKALCRGAAALCRERGVELGKLSVWHNIQNPEIHTTLLGFGSMAVLRLNLAVVQHGLTKEEDDVYRELLATVFMAPLPGGWEGAEIEEFNRAGRAARFVSEGRTVVCVGRNYADHCSELGNAVPSSPLLFLKPVSAYIEAGAAVSLPRGAAQIHHEVELGVVVGAPLSRAGPEAALRCVAGYCLALDMTDRAAQAEAKSKGTPWAVAKGFDTSLPVSEFLPSARLPEPQAAQLWCRVNGQLRQQGDTKDMIFPLADLLSYVSHKFSLSPGDVVLTGTPAGVGPVKAGDTITAGLRAGPGGADLLSLSFPVRAAE